MIKGVIFDMDGLILDTEKLYQRFWKEASKEFGYDMPREIALKLRSLDKTQKRVSVSLWSTLKNTDIK